VPYIKEEKGKIQRFISGFLVSFKDNIEFDELRSLEEAIRKLKYCYEKSNTYLRLCRIGRVMRRIMERGLRREERHRILMTRRMQHRIRSSMH